MGKKIYLASPHMSDEGYEMAYIKEAFDTNWIAPLDSEVENPNTQQAVGMSLLPLHHPRKSSLQGKNSRSA